MKEKIINKNSINEFFYKTNPKGGISLIVLVITIIVVIILAAAVIISLQNNNPMVEANKARINSDVANMQAIFTNTVGKIMAENQDVVEIDKSQLNTVTSGKKAVGVAVYKIKGTAKEGEIKFDTGTKTGTTYYTGRQLPLYNKETKWYVDSQGLVSVNIGGTKYGEGKQDGEVTPPTLEDTVYEEAVVGEKVTGSVKQYTDADGDVAIIPIDFAVVPGKTDISNGLVISDVANDTGDTGNQFVWVPVNDMSTFVREAGYIEGVIQTDIDFSKCSEPLNYNGTVAEETEKNEYNNMISSIKEYHGFYIARYEMSSNGERDNKYISKKGFYPISYYYINSWSIIKELARSFYPESSASKGKVVSTLPYGVCWDETIRFIKKNYPNIEKDSRGYGNYATIDESGNKVNSSIMKTGSKEEYALNNIYDMAGNVSEYTMESYESNQCIIRGGSCGSSGITVPISRRLSTYQNTSSGSYTCARVQLYIK